MFKISKEIYDQIFHDGKDEIVTEIDNSFDFDELLKFDQFEDRVNYLKGKCQFVGEGSSRTTFILNDKIALKIAKNEKGIAQNENEIKLAETLNALDGFATIFDWDKKSYSALTTELCSPLEDDQSGVDTFYEMFKMTPMETIDMLLYLYEQDGTTTHLRKKMKLILASEDRSFSDLCDMVEKQYLSSVLDCMSKVEMMEKARINLKFLDMYDDKNNPQGQVLRSIIDFQIKTNGEKVIFDDMTNPANWGMINRNGKDCLVIIDAGLSDQIANDYYRK